MQTREVIESYFKKLKAKADWPSTFADDTVFTSFTSPIKEVKGRDAFVESTKRFYSMIASVSVRQLIVEGTNACALTSYTLQPPGGPSFTSDVAEVFSVSDGKIKSLGIYFDTAPFPKR